MSTCFKFFDAAQDLIEVETDEDKINGNTVTIISTLSDVDFEPDGENQERLKELYEKEAEIMRAARIDDFEKLDEYNEAMEEVTEALEEEWDQMTFQNLEYEDILPLMESRFSDTKTAYMLGHLCEMSLESIDDIEEKENDTWELDGQTYLAGTDDDMDYWWDQDLQNYLDDCVYPELERAGIGNLANYFDDERWKSDAKQDGRAHSLARYDGCEECMQVDGEWIYAYRTD